MCTYRFKVQIKFKMQSLVNIDVYYLLVNIDVNNSHNGELENNGNVSTYLQVCNEVWCGAFHSNFYRAMFTSSLNSPSLSVDFNGPKWLKTGEGMFNNWLNTEQWQRATQHWKQVFYMGLLNFSPKLNKLCSLIRNLEKHLASIIIT